jgi:molybdopterin/thiamine biosynthesis adenylyltransferase
MELFMKRASNHSPSSFGETVAVRLGRNVANVLYEHMRRGARFNEQMAFGLAASARTAEGAVFIVTELILPDKSDLCEQSAVGVCPIPEFQSMVYWRAYQTRKSIVEFHTHPGADVPHFSGIDDAHAHPNAEYICGKLPEPVTLIMVVGNNRFDAFDAVVYDRQLHQFREVDRIEVLGRPSELRKVGEPADAAEGEADGVFDRQELIPGWNQIGLERQRIGIVGAGGNGAPLFQTLVSIGAGRQGWIAIVDADLVEASNKPRIPYAVSEHCGTPKVTVAAQYAGRKSPATPVFPFPCKLDQKAVIDRLKAATVIFGCVDNDGGRKELNELAVRYGIPLIDLGCDIQTEGSQVVAGGQVRVVLPGENACLVCCRGFDASQAAIDQMDDIGRARRAAHGYVQNSTALATPSAANLNALTAQWAIAQSLALVNGEQFAKWDYLHFDQFTGQTIPASSKRRPECPCCGQNGFWGMGDPVETAKKRQPLLKKLLLNA